jgi:hypothetical protein
MSKGWPQNQRTLLQRIADGLRSAACDHNWNRKPPPCSSITYVCMKCRGERGPAPYSGSVWYPKNGEGNA